MKTIDTKGDYPLPWLLEVCVPDDEWMDCAEAGDTMGTGVRFPDGRVYIDWNRNLFPEDEQLAHSHISIYGSVEDAEQGTGGDVELISSTSDRARHAEVQEV